MKSLDNLRCLCYHDNGRLAAPDSLTAVWGNLNARLLSRTSRSLPTGGFAEDGKYIRRSSGRIVGRKDGVPIRRPPLSLLVFLRIAFQNMWTQ